MVEIQSWEGMLCPLSLVSWLDTGSNYPLLTFSREISVLWSSRSSLKLLLNVFLTIFRMRSDRVLA